MWKSCCLHKCISLWLGFWREEVRAALGVCAFPTGRGAVGYLLLMPIRAAQCLLSERFIAIG